jgi:hypothetical protein
MPKSRIETRVSNVGLEFVVVEIPNQPASYSILRARAQVTDGPATQVAMKVMERGSGPDICTVLEYSLSDNDGLAEIDAWEDGEIFFHAKVRAGLNNSGTGTTFIGVKCDDVGNIVEVHLDILLEG